MTQNILSVQLIRLKIERFHTDPEIQEQEEK